MALIATILNLQGTELACEQWTRRRGPQLRAEYWQSDPELAWVDPAWV